MKEHSMLFSTPMVQAILEDRKTMTRRLNGLEEINQDPDNFWFWDFILPEGIVVLDQPSGEIVTVKCPYSVGDRIWVKETWAVDSMWDEVKPSEIDPCAAVWYATEAKGEWVGKIRSPRFMPKRAARIWREIVEIKPPERVQDISEEDAEAEGCNFNEGYSFGRDYSAMTYRELFQRLWDSLYAKKGLRWERNPWLWPLQFRRV